MNSTAERALGKHYRGELGSEYFAWQKEGGPLCAQIERTKFEPWVGPTDTLVDFGCGAGHLLELLPAGERIGIEPNDAARAAAVARGLRIVESCAELPDGCADVVISNHALEHTLAPWQELCDIRRVLRPGGRLVLWVPLDDWRTQRRAREDINHHLYAWTPLLLQNLLLEAEYEVERVKVVTHAWPQFHEELFRVLPRPAFDVAARAWAVITRRRQVMAVATRPTTSPDAT